MARVVGGEPAGSVEFRLRADGAPRVVTRFGWSTTGGDDPLAEVINVTTEEGEVAVAEEAMAERRAQWRTALAGTGTTVFMVDDEMRVRWAENSQFDPTHEVAGRRVSEVAPGPVGDTVEEVFTTILETGIPRTFDVTLARGGGELVIAVTGQPWRDAAGRLAGVVGIGTDVSDRVRMVREIEAAAETDGLTGLPNRQALARAVDRVGVDGDGGLPAVLIALDVPGFSAVNDVHGHEAGDACLRAIAEHLAGHVHDDDLVARIGGDQFAVLVPPRRSGEAESLARALVSGLEGLEVTVDDLPIRFEVVAGIAEAGRERAASAILADVDIALSRAKRTRETIAVVDADARAHREAVARRVDWGHRLRVALGADDVLVMAQPIVDLATGATDAFELLVRLVVDGAPVSAAAFMPDIELLGLTPLLDRWMVRHALVLAARHRGAAAGRRLTVNVSATTLVEGHLLQVLDAAAAETGVPASMLAIEMTETEIVSDIGRARSVVEGVRARGALFVLDDFGSGTAVAEHLRDLPVDWVKIDGRFVAGAPGDPVDRAIVAGTLAVADAVGIPVVAEWIEDDACRVLMREMGARYGQGYHLGRPGPVGEVLAAR